MSPPPPSPPPGLDVDVTDALHYLDAVKARFHDQPEAYKEFLGVLSALKTGELVPVYSVNSSLTSPGLT